MRVLPPGAHCPDSFIEQALTGIVYRHKEAVDTQIGHRYMFPDLEQIGHD